MTIHSEAADQLRKAFVHEPVSWRRAELLQEALAAAKAEGAREAVERIRAKALAARERWGAEGLPASLESILNEEFES